MQDLHDEMIRDRIVVGLRDARLSEKLQLDPELTLEKAVTQVRQAEAVKQQQSLMRGATVNHKQPDTHVGAVRKRRPTRPKQQRSDKGEKTPKTTCGWCGKAPSHEKQQCPAKDAVCHKCSKHGHFKKVCRSAKVGELHLNTHSETEEDLFLGGLTGGSEDLHKNPWSIVLSLNGKPTKFEIDTGAEVTVISERAHRNIGSPKLRPPQKTLRGPSNQELFVKGQFTAKLKNSDREVEQELFVVKDLHRHLLGRPAIKVLDLAARVGVVEEDEKSPVARYPNLFTGLGKLDGEYSIQLEDGAKPFALTVPRRVAIPLMQPVKEELARMEKLGVISRVSEPTEWCAGMVVVPKGNKNVRICVDLTHLNKSVRRDTFFQLWSSPWHSLQVLAYFQP